MTGRIAILLILSFLLPSLAVAQSEVTVFTVEVNSGEFRAWRVDTQNPQNIQSLFRVSGVNFFLTDSISLSDGSILLLGKFNASSINNRADTVLRLNARDGSLEDLIDLSAISSITSYPISINDCGGSPLVISNNGEAYLLDFIAGSLQPVQTALPTIVSNQSSADCSTGHLYSLGSNSVLQHHFANGFTRAFRLGSGALPILRGLHARYGVVAFMNMTFTSPLTGNLFVYDGISGTPGRSYRIPFPATSMIFDDLGYLSTTLLYSQIVKSRATGNLELATTDLNSGSTTFIPIPASLYSIAVGITGY